MAATAEPEIAPNIIQDITLTSARPPGKKPTIAIADSIKRLAMPPCPMIRPDKIKNGMASSAKLSIPPIICCAMVVAAGVKSMCKTSANKVDRAILIEIGTLINSSVKKQTSNKMAVISIILAPVFV